MWNKMFSLIDNKKELQTLALGNNSAVAQLTN